MDVESRGLRMEAQEAVVLRICPACLDGHSIDLEAVAAVARLFIHQSAQMLEGDEPRSRSVDGRNDSCDDACFDLFGVVHDLNVGVDVGRSNA